jgi:putative endonuclease
MNTREKGAQKEQQVCAYLLSAGVEILERNFRARQGEIDIIGRDGGSFLKSNTGQGTAGAARRKRWEAPSKRKSVRQRIIIDCAITVGKIHRFGLMW